MQGSSHVLALWGSQGWIVSTSGLLQEARERDPGAHRTLAAAILSVQYMLQCLASHV